MGTSVPTSALTVEHIEQLLDASIRVNSEAHRTDALLYYEPANSVLFDAHQSMARIVGVFGGNRSGKTEFGAVEASILATGIVPRSLQGKYPQEKLRGDVLRGLYLRVAGVDFVNGVSKTLLPKFRDGDEFHGPWIPPRCLAGGNWEKAYSAATRTLAIVRETNTNGIVRRLRDYAHIEFCSYDQEVTRFSGVARHLTWFDETPTEPIWKECQMRHVSTRGRSLVTLTPPDTSGDIAWVFDEVYEPGLPGHPRYDPKRVRCYTIWTEHNRYLPQDEVEHVRGHLSPDEQENRLHGAFRHLAGLVYPQFRAVPDSSATCHVIEPFEIPHNWPIVMVCDPHPRTPWAICWAAVDPHDTVYVFDELWGGAETVEEYAKLIRLREGAHSSQPQARIIDPAAEKSDNLQTHGFTIRRALDQHGIRCKLADNDFTTGRSKLIEMLRGPSPRLQVFRTCVQVIHQLQRHVWSEFSSAVTGRDPKQVPQERMKHFPDCLRYLAMESPTYGLRIGQMIKPYTVGPFKRPTIRRGGRHGAHLYSRTPR